MKNFSRPMVLFLALAWAASLGAAETVITLWPEGVPGLRADATPEKDDGEGRYTNIHHPTLVVYAPPTGTANGTAILYAPGGGYQRISAGAGGGIVTRWLHSLGITVYMLKYRHAEYGHPAPLQDALRAVRLLRSRAAELGIKHLGMLGGSAGGHLTACAGTLYDAPEGRTGAELDKISGRPDFMVLIFPMISLQDARTADGQRHPLLGLNPTDELKHHLSVDEQVTKDTPPTFLVHSAEDARLVEGSVLFSTAMRRAGAPMELHIYAMGPHGDGMSPALGPISEWPRLCELWMRANGWLPSLQAEHAQQLLDADFVVRSDAFEDAGKCPNFDRVVIGNCLVVLSVSLRGHADMRTALPILLISQHSQRLDQLRAGDVARQLHRVSTSSRT